MERNNSYSCSIFCLLVAGLLIASTEAQINSSSLLPLPGSTESTVNNSTVEQLSGYSLPWDTPFNLTGRYPSVILNNDLLSLLSQLQWLLPLSNTADKPDIKKNADQPEKEEGASGNQPDPENQQAGESSAAEGGGQAPETSGADHSEIINEVLYIESILLERYALATGAEFQRPSILPDPLECPQSMGLTGLSTAELEKKLIEYSSRGNLHAMLVLVIHYLGGLLTYDPPRAGELLRRIRSRSSQEEVRSFLQTFCHDRQSAISVYRAYTMFMAAICRFQLARDPLPFETGPAVQLPSRGGSHPVLVQHTQHHGRNFPIVQYAGSTFMDLGDIDNATLLTQAAMILEAGVESEMSAQIDWLLLLLSRSHGYQTGSAHSPFPGPPEQRAIALASFMSPNLTALGVYRGWLLYYLGRYIEENGMVQLTAELFSRNHDLLSSIGVTWEDRHNSVLLTSPPAHFYKQAAENGCIAAMVGLVARLKNVAEDPRNTGSEKELAVRIEHFTQRLLRVFNGFDRLIEYLMQIKPDTTLKVAWAFQQTLHYNMVAKIYRGLTRLSVPAAYHRLAWLIHQKKVDGSPKEAAKLYLQAIEMGYKRSEKRLDQLQKSHPEVMR